MSQDPKTACAASAVSPETVHLVRGSWAGVQPNAGSAAVVFHARLFALDATLPSLLRGDTLEQGEKLMRMIDVAVELLDDRTGLVPALHDVGKRHAGYGMTTAHYTLVGTALIGTLHEMLGDAFDRRTRDAWTAVYRVIADTMCGVAQALAMPSLASSL